MITLGLDPSLRSYGFLVLDSSKTGLKSIIASGHSETFKSDVPVTRFMHFRSMIFDLIKKYKVDLVGLESPAYGGGPFSETHFGLMMFSSEAVFELRKDLVLFDPSTLKHLATGKSTADKQDMLRAFQLKLVTTKHLQNDEVDAYFVAYFATRLQLIKTLKLNPDQLSDQEKRVFLTRTKKTKGVLGTQIKKTAHVFRENSRYFTFSKIPAGSVSLPKKEDVNQNLLDWLDQ